MNLTSENYKICLLCPRNCKINRTAGNIGYCGETASLRIATIEPHFGEEPPISGSNGSGTVFFSGCPLKCGYCQNFQISSEGMGNEMTTENVVARLAELHQAHNIHNVNFVTPDHFFPHCVEIVAQLRTQGVLIPAVYNLSGYQKSESIRALEEFADIYLVDYKYSNAALAKSLSNAGDYPETALAAISEMVRQKGMLDSFTSDTEIATRGVLVRHLILPGHIPNSLDALTTLFLEFGADLPVSLMSQYAPHGGCKPNCPSRILETAEFEQVYEHVQSLGFKHLFVQFPEENVLDERPFLPDFEQERAFRGNVR